MDDFYLIHHDKSYLKYCLEVITAFRSTLNLSLNGKTQIFPIKTEAITFGSIHTSMQMAK